MFAHHAHDNDDDDDDVQEAKARVYKVTHLAARHAQRSVPKPQVVPVLEEMPKWELLRHVSEEIQTQRGLLASRADSAPDSATRSNGGGTTCGTPRAAAAASPIDLLNSASPVRKASRRSNDDVATGTTVAVGTEAAQAEHVEWQKGEGYEWIDKLTQQEAQALKDAPVLLVAKQQHMLTELKSILAVRPCIVSFVGWLHFGVEIDVCATAAQALMHATRAGQWRPEVHAETV